MVGTTISHYGILEKPGGGGTEVVPRGRDCIQSALTRPGLGAGVSLFQAP